MKHRSGRTCFPGMQADGIPWAARKVSNRAVAAWIEADQESQRRPTVLLPRRAHRTKQAYRQAVRIPTNAPVQKWNLFKERLDLPTQTWR